MHILFLTQIIPYPPDAGPKVKTWHVLRYLAGKGYRVTLASFVRPEEEEHIAALKEVCQDVYTVPIQRSRVKDVGYWLRSNLTGRPFLIERDDLEKMRKLVEQIVAQDKVDIIHADQLTMTQFAMPRNLSKSEPSANGRNGSQPFRIFDAHNAVWTIVERMKENAPWFLKPIAGWEAQRIKHYEGGIVSHFEHTLAVTEPDRLALEDAVASVSDHPGNHSDSITVVPIAVDTQVLQPVQRSPGSKNILTLGTLHYPPNADGIRWFANEVFPLIQAREPEVTLTIIGKNPPADFYQLQDKNPQAIKITGYVEDLTPYFEQAAVMVIAVRAGGGMRVRILEAFARGMPVVTTTVGLEGIDANPGEHVLVEDTPQEFAQATLQLLADPSLASNLAQRGRVLAEEKYDWQVVLLHMDAVYENLAGQKLEVERVNV
ncbi:MAG: glycosyltransferase family 4 protein [Anaerolineales bacterium]|nr:glycosyltransferase family 4 protein [Anaerolineales bacterium]